MDDSPSILLIGLPQTGKSTFIGTLYHVLNNSDEIDAETLELETLYGDEKYIIGLRDSWIRFEAVERTIFADEHQITTFNILDPITQKRFKLNIPDLSGEVFRRMIEEREKPESFESLIDSAKGFMLFVNCKNYTRATPISSALPDWDEEDDQDDDNETVLTEWGHEYVPTQVKLIELLQFLISTKNTDIIKLNLILSAWDVISDIYDDPFLFYKTEFPMLKQFLESNKKQVEFELFGLSAQGCNYDRGILPNELAKKFRSSISRIQVIKNGTKSHDLTLTLRNLIE